MAARRNEIALVVAATLVFLAGCVRFGQVSQGRVIDYDREKGVVTLIQDSNYMEAGNPRYEVLPPLTVRVPRDPREMGPPPEAGKLLALDVRNHTLTIYHAEQKALRTVPFTPVAQVDKVSALDKRVAKLPAIDRAKGTISVYSASDSILVIFSVPDEYMGLPDDTWKMGDEVRYYYKQPDQALRMMNVTKTDLTKGR